MYCCVCIVVDVSYNNNKLNIRMSGTACCCGGTTRMNCPKKSPLVTSIPIAQETHVIRTQHLRLVTESSLQFKTRQSIMDLAPEMCHIKSYYPMLGMILTISWSHIWQICNNYIDSQIPKKIKK
jgi:hypothetical protein